MKRVSWVAWGVVGCVLASAPVVLAGEHVNAVSCGHIAKAVVLQGYDPRQFIYSVGYELQAEALAERVAAKVLSRLQAPEAKVQSSGGSLLRTNCQACHVREGVVDVSGPALSCEQKLDAVKRLLLPASDVRHMPRGATLSAQDLGDLLGELSGAK